MRTALILAAILIMLMPAESAAEPGDAALPPYFAFSTAVTSQQLGTSWRAGCPVPPEDLRLIVLLHVGMDGHAHAGQLVVHRDIAGEVSVIFGELYRMRYPIDKLRTVDNYGADDEKSMEDNNSSAFNCREITGGGGWSKHSYGRAIDINTRINPYVSADGSVVLPTNGTEYVDRSQHVPGMLHAGDPAVRAFTDRGWTWGGSWTDPIDYQHFEKSVVGN